MAWLWNSWEEYSDYVQPLSVRRPIFRSAKRATAFRAQRELQDSIRIVKENVTKLRSLGFTGRDNEPPPTDVRVLDEARHVARELIHAGEKLLIYHKRLATSDRAYGFLHQHEIFEMLNASSDSMAMVIEIEQLVKDTDELAGGLYEIETDDEKLFLHDLDLPTQLETDFRIARNLFSVGLDEIGVFVAGRGLERVLREIAKLRRVMIQKKNEVEAASESDLFDLIETMARIRWKSSGERLLTADTKALLHYLRTMRNATAHPTRNLNATIAPREIAKILAETANRLWKDVTKTRARFSETTIRKNW